MSPQTAFHGRCMRLLENSLLEQAPDHLDVMREMTIKLDTKNRPEPDVLVFPVEANTGPRQTWYQPRGHRPRRRSRLRRVPRTRSRGQAPQVRRSRVPALLAGRGGRRQGPPRRLRLRTRPGHQVLRPHRNLPRPPQAHRPVRGRDRPDGDQPATRRFGGTSGLTGRGGVRRMLRTPPRALTRWRYGPATRDSRRRPAPRLPKPRWPYRPGRTPRTRESSSMRPMIVWYFTNCASVCRNSEMTLWCHDRNR